MSVVRAGDVRQLTIDGREFDAAPESSCTVHLGGFTNAFARNGNGTGHVTQKRASAGITDLVLSIDDARQDLEFLQSRADAGQAVPVTLTLTSAKTYSGSLVLVAEDLGKASGEGTATLSLMGERFEQI